MAENGLENTMTAKLTLVEPLLGTLPADPEIAREYVLSNHPREALAPDEDGQLPEEEFEAGITTFARDHEGRPMLWDYQIKGFFKEAALAMIESGVLSVAEMKALKLTPYTYKRTIDNGLFPSPRRLVFEETDAERDCPGWGLTPGPRGLPLLQRPLRKENFKGGTVCLASSEVIAAGATLTMSVTCLNPKLLEVVRKWLDYGRLKGLGQWRNSGFGRFTWEQVNEPDQAAEAASRRVDG